MSADEEGTLARLMSYRRALLEPKIAEHHGRIVKTTGDGLLAEFPSVVDAVRCAVEVQRRMANRVLDAIEQHWATWRGAMTTATSGSSVA
jgi:adenylate cyclase